MILLLLACIINGKDSETEQRLLYQFKDYDNVESLTHGRELFQENNPPPNQNPTKRPTKKP